MIITTVHPGIVRTFAPRVCLYNCSTLANIGNSGLSNEFLSSKGIPTLLLSVLSPLFLTPEKGCWTTLYAAASPEVTIGDNGVYFTSFVKRTAPAAAAKDQRLVDRLWEWTEQELTGKGY